MSLRCMRAVLVVLGLGLASAAAFAFETVDRLPFPSLGRFPAYDRDPVGPWTLFAYAGLMHDSNVFRRETGERSDVVARYGLGASALARVIGRQYVRGEVVGEYYDFNSLSEVDHFGYRVTGEWLWEIGNQLSGIAGYSRQRRHADLGEFPVERRAMVTTDRLDFDAGYDFAANWRIYGGAEYSRSRREIDESADLDANTVRGGLAYRTPVGTAVGIEARHTRGHARIPDTIAGISFRDDYEEREVAATLSYALGAQLRVSGRVGHTERDYDEVQGRNFSGTTYRGGVLWLPTTKVRLIFDAYRLPMSAIDIDTHHVLRRGTGFGADYAPTLKLVFMARFVNEHRQNVGSAESVILGTPPFDDTLRIWRFGAGWEPQRHWHVGAGYDIGERRSNTLGRGYDYQQVMLNARFTF